MAPRGNKKKPAREGNKGMNAAAPKTRTKEAIRYRRTLPLGNGIFGRSARAGLSTLTAVLAIVLAMVLAMVCAMATLLPAAAAAAQQESAPQATPQQSSTEKTPETTDEYNRRLDQLGQLLESGALQPAGGLPAGTARDEYVIGPEDLLEITVFEAAEMSRTVRVAAGGEITLPLVGPVRAAGLTPRALESVIEELLRRTYLKDPHAGVFVREMQSHPVSVFGAVKRPGVYQLRGEKTLIEVLALAEGLAEDAGDTVVVEHGATYGRAGLEPPRAETVEVSLKNLLTSSDTRSNVRVRPGDIVKVTRAGIVYVIGEVKKPGGFMLRTNENISVLQALALAEGLTRTSAKSQTRIIRTNPETGAREEVRVRLGDILSGHAPDLVLRARDIVYVPNSSLKSALMRGSEAAISIVSGALIYHR
jgi:polysaccharide export outer membrane protein